MPEINLMFEAKSGWLWFVDISSRKIINEPRNLAAHLTRVAPPRPAPGTSKKKDGLSRRRNVETLFFAGFDPEIPEWLNHLSLECCFFPLHRKRVLLFNWSKTMGTEARSKEQGPQIMFMTVRKDPPWDVFNTRGFARPSITKGVSPCSEHLAESAARPGHGSFLVHQPPGDKTEHPKKNAIQIVTSWECCKAVWFD